jgi:phosphoserine phosphatase RsbU/P
MARVVRLVAVDVIAGMTNTDLHELFPVLISQVTTDLAESIHATWAIAMMGDDHLLPVFTVGQPPDLDGCVAQTAEVLFRERQPAVTPHSLSSDGSASHNRMAEIVHPLRMHGDIVGALAFGPKMGRSRYTSTDQDLIADFSAHITTLMNNRTLASRVAANIERMQRTRQEIESAREVQHRLFPYRMPSVEGLDYYGECQPVGDVGGDFFDFIALETSALLVSIGDVSERGIPAALIMAGVQASLRALALTSGGRMAAVAQQLNRIVSDLSPTNFHTSLFFGQIDPVLRQLLYVNAGHGPALLFRRNTNGVTRLENSGTALGFSPGTAYQQRALSLDPGDVLVAFTEHMANDAGNPTLEQVVIETLRNYPNASSSDLAGEIMRAVNNSGHGLALDHDRTVVVVRLIEAAAGLAFRLPERRAMACAV